MQKQTALGPGVKTGLNGQMLKFIAIAAMLADHVAWAFVETFSPLGIAMHFIGGITGPVMFYLLVEGYYNTRNIYKYCNRMLLFALISWPCFVFFEHGFTTKLENWMNLGVIFTLYLGLMMLRARHEIKSPLLRVLAIGGLIFLSLLGDWAIFGMLYILIFDTWREKPLVRDIATGVLILILAIPNDFSNWAYVVIQLGKVVPILLIRFYNGERGKKTAASKYFFYIFYPLHLLVIGALKLLLV